MDWNKWLDFNLTNIEEAKKCPLTVQMLQMVFEKIHFEWDSLDDYSKAQYIEQIAMEMPSHIGKSKKYASPLREEQLLKWQLYLEMIISKDYISIPEKINLDRYKTTIEKYISNIKKLIKKEDPKKKPEVLIDIWEGDQNSYDTYINYLKRNHSSIGGPFINEIKNNLTWLKRPQKGWVQYLAAFIYTCIENKWIQDSYSANELKSLLEKTFNVDFNPKPFKSLSIMPPGDKYLKPFKLLPVNLN